MYKYKIPSFAISLFALILFFSCGQNLNEVQIIKSFLREVYNNKPLDQISKTYRYRCNEENAHEKFIKNVKYLQIDKKHLYNTFEKIKVEPYNDSEIEDLWPFETKEGEKIYVTSLDGKLEFYVLMKDFKIVSYVYFRKGGDNPAYFIPYWMISLE